MSSAVDLLLKAVEYDKNGRRMEALKLYQSGISDLFKVYQGEENAEKKAYFQSKIKEYMSRAEQIKTNIKERTSKGELKDKIFIMEGSTGHSYEDVFGKYLDKDCREICLEEPYLREHFQFSNLVKFCELLVVNCVNLKYINVTTSKDPRDNSDQTKAFKNLHDSLKDKCISFNVEYSEHIHDRQIILSNGYVIKIGRGLHYFKASASKYALGTHHFSLRPCAQTNVDIFFCPENKKE